MEKKDFYDKYLKGKYFMFDSIADAKSLSKMSEVLGVDFKAARLKNSKYACTMDMDLFNKWSKTFNISGEETSPWIIQGIWDVEVEKNVPKLESMHLVKTEDGTIYSIFNLDGTLWAICFQNHQAIIVDYHFLKTVIKVVLPPVDYDVQKFDEYPTVWESELEKKPKAFIVWSDNQHQDATLDYVVANGYRIKEWDTNLGVKENYNVIDKCDKLFYVLPDGFLETRIIPISVYQDIQIFMQNHNLEDISLLLFEDKQMSTCLLYTSDAADERLV